ncbi:sensor histidine kinase [Actinomadura oligospora]|uniref:sensor histidine kinase n=1 Tax=Actinomadura oligospora TaxID=111804 RepID=UPI00047C36F6|nr:ATP-binding protein [Actinomadura oligospora]
MSIRLRLTLLYGVLFLVSGLALLTVVYVLVAHAPPWSAVDPPKAPATPTLPRGLGPNAPTMPDLRAELAHQRADYLRDLLTASGVALALMTVGSVWLGWLMAGRALRPLRTMTDNARAISANDLHRRLSLGGPDDELKGLADTFDDLLDHLEGAFEAQRRFVANASHELRTPLTYERSLLEVSLADPNATAAELRDACERVLGGNQRQGELIEALLTLARSQRGLDRRTRLDLAISAGEVLDLARRDVAADPPVFDVELDSAPVLGDPPLLERLIVNLADNAVRHNVPGGRVTIRTGVRDGRSELVVRNTGPVVPADQVDTIFQPFQRLAATRLAGRDGHGIGLSIVAAIVTAHDGDLHAEAPPEGGLEVTVRFPQAT